MNIKYSLWIFVAFLFSYQHAACVTDHLGPFARSRIRDFEYKIKELKNDMLDLLSKIEKEINKVDTLPIKISARASIESLEAPPSNSVNCNDQLLPLNSNDDTDRKLVKTPRPNLVQNHMQYYKWLSALDGPKQRQVFGQQLFGTHIHQQHRPNSIMWISQSPPNNLANNPHPSTIGNGQQHRPGHVHIPFKPIGQPDHKPTGNGQPGHGHEHHTPSHNLSNSDSGHHHHDHGKEHENKDLPHSENSHHQPGHDHQHHPAHTLRPFIPNGPENGHEKNEVASTTQAPQKQFLRMPTGPLWKEYYNSRFIPSEYIDLDNKRVSTDVLYDFNKYLLNKFEENSNPKEFAINVDEQLPNFAAEPQRPQGNQNPSHNHAYVPTKNENQNYGKPSLSNSFEFLASNHGQAGSYKPTYHVYQGVSAAPPLPTTMMVPENTEIPTGTPNQSASQSSDTNSKSEESYDSSKGGNGGNDSTNESESVTTSEDDKSDSDKLGDSRARKMDEQPPQC